MVSDAVPKQRTVLATPLNVEESRAQRQQRSQARFRDRGGIFVPSNRSTLADILLGKAPPLNRQRSVTASPSTHLQKGTQPTKLRRISSPTKQKAPARKASQSPQKKGRKSMHGSGEENMTAGVAQAKAKGTGARTPRKSLRHGEIGHLVTENEPRRHKAQSKRKSSTSKLLPEIAERETEVEVKASKAKGKDSSSTSVHRALSAKSKSKGTSGGEAVSIPQAHQIPVASASTSLKAANKKPARSRRKTSDLYSGASEDEYVPKVAKPRAKARASTSSTSKPALKKLIREPPQTGPSKLTDIIEEDEEADENPPGQVESPSTHSALSQKVSKKEEVSKLKKRPAQAEEEGDPPPTSPAKRVKVIRGQAGNDSEPTTKTKTKGSKTKNKSMEVESLPPAAQQSVPSQPSDPSSSRSKTSVIKSSKRPTNDKHEAEPRSAAVKSSRRIHDDPAEKTSTKPRAKRVASENVPTSRKRTREQEEDTLEEVKPTKRRKEAPSRAKASKLESTAQAKKASSKQKGPAKVTKKPPSKAKAAKGASKHSDISASGTSVPPRRGPPRSVLQRLKVLQSQPLEVDNEPDPIDFLS